MRILVFLAALFWCVPVYCQQFTGITVSPSEPVFGEMVSFSADGTNYGDVKSFDWEWKYTGGDCPQWRAHSSHMQTIQHFENKPGTFKIRLTIKFHPVWYPPMQRPDMVFEKDILVEPPTRVEIVEGLNVHIPPAIGLGIHMKFKLFAGDQECGPNTGGMFAQEKISVQQTYPPLLPAEFPPDSPWVPVPPQQPYGVFWLSTNVINDVKRAEFSPTVYAQAQVGNVFHTYKQELRLMYQDPCGDWQIIPLTPAFWFESYKSGDSTWSVREQ